MSSTSDEMTFPQVAPEGHQGGGRTLDAWWGDRQGEKAVEEESGCYSDVTHSFSTLVCDCSYTKKNTALGLYFNFFLTQSFFSSFLLLTWHLISKYGKADVSFLFLPHLIVTDDVVTFVHIYAKPNDRKHNYFYAYCATNLEFGLSHTLGGRHYLKDLLS